MVGGIRHLCRLKVQLFRFAIRQIRDSTHPSGIILLSLMHGSDRNGLNRRDFIKQTTLAVGTIGVGLSLEGTSYAAASPGTVQIVCAPEDLTAAAPPVDWAVGYLKEALVNRSVAVRRTGRIEQGGDVVVVVASSHSALSNQLCATAGITAPHAEESLGLVPTKTGKRRVALVVGNDERGLVYGVLELAERVRFTRRPQEAFDFREPVLEKPANVIRSVARSFVSDVEDKPWYYDRDFWRRYLTMLAAQRFNRFNLMFGIGYDFTRGIRDCYFHFAYPFLVSPAGYDVKAVPLPDKERERNLETLRFISDETARRGLHFQLGLWTHAYRWTDSPHANYTIEGLTPETQGAYCRDALTALLKACPAISGVTFRVHGESGVPEGSYAFWKTVFDGVVGCGRQVQIDMHAKGMDQQMIDVAVGTGMPVTLSPKYWAEHMGLPYMQGAIRPQEMPPRNAKDTGFFAKSSGSRRFLRYGYGDLLKEDRDYGVLHRMWPGTQRLLLWGSPSLAQNYGRASSFCGSLGVELCEPLSFKGRKGSGLPGGRCAYADASLRPTGGDFEKFVYTYTVWGRNLYNPDTDPDCWRRLLRNEFGRGSANVERSLSAATWILPLVTTAHCPSAANNNYWPEMYTNMPMANASRPNPYTWDTLSPKLFGAVSSLDPELFSRMDDFAGDLLAGGPGAKYSPAWVAERLLEFAGETETYLAKARSSVSAPKEPAFRRFATDAAIVVGLGRFFAWKFRAGVAFAIHQRTKDGPALKQAIAHDRQARAEWARLAEVAKGIYLNDVTFGYEPQLRGHWLDRLGAMDDDIGDLEELLEQLPGKGAPSTGVEAEKAARALRTLEHAGVAAPVLTGFHVPQGSFERGKTVVIQASLDQSRRIPRLASIHLRYRHVDQAEEWKSVLMDTRGRAYRSEIPAAYTDSPFPLQYHFELRPAKGDAWLYPGLSLSNWHPPFFTLRQAT